MPEHNTSAADHIYFHVNNTKDEGCCLKVAQSLLRLGRLLGTSVYNVQDLDGHTLQAPKESLMPLQLGPLVADPFLARPRATF